MGFTAETLVFRKRLYVPQHFDERFYCFYSLYPYLSLSLYIYIHNHFFFRFSPVPVPYKRTYHNVNTYSVIYTGGYVYTYVLILTNRVRDRHHQHGSFGSRRRRRWCPYCPTGSNNPLFLRASLPAPVIPFYGPWRVPRSPSLFVLSRRRSLPLARNPPARPAVSLSADDAFPSASPGR